MDSAIKSSSSLACAINVELIMSDKQNNKCVDDTTPLVRYVMDKSLRLTEAQHQLYEETLKQPESYMLGDPIVHQLTANLMRLINAKKVLDIGIYTGASSLSAALAIPEDGRVFALDRSNDYLSIARKYWKQAGVNSKINLKLGPAIETLQELIGNGQSGTFDFAFIDGDNESYIKYYEKCLTLIRPGGIIAVDNTILSERVILDESQVDPKDKATRGIRAFNEKVKDDERIDISYLTIGDGLTLCFKK